MIRFFRVSALLLALVTFVRADEVVITFENASALTVAVAGTFNEWSSSAAPMLRDSSGLWSVRFELAPGRYEYKFVLDGGTWVADPRAVVSLANADGNSILLVGVVEVVEKMSPAVFECDGPGDAPVFLVGDFNGWSETATPMVRIENGNWKVSVPLEGGVYRYVFRSAGQVIRASTDAWEQITENQGDNVRFHMPPHPGLTCQYRLKLKAPDASRVVVVGEFTNWLINPRELQDRDGDGVWEIEVSLKPGIYQYKYLVENVEWIPDPGADDYLHDDNGNSLLIADTSYEENRPETLNPVRLMKLAPVVRYAHASKIAFATLVLARYEESRKAAQQAFLWAMSLDAGSVGMALWRIARVEFETGHDSEALRLLHLSRRILPDVSTTAQDEVYVKTATISDKAASGFTPLLYEAYRAVLTTAEADMKRGFWREHTKPNWGFFEEYFGLWLDHLIGNDSKARTNLEYACRLSAGYDVRGFPLAANLYMGMLARDLRDTLTAAIHLDSALALDPNHLFARYFRDHLAPFTGSRSDSSLPGFYFLGVRQQGRRWSHLGQEEAITEALREEIERSAVMRWVDADDLRRFAVEKGIAFSRATGSRRFFDEYAKARNVPIVGELHIRHEGKAIHCELITGRFEDLQLKDITASLDQERAESVIFLTQGTRRLDDMAVRVRDELVARVDVAAKVIGVAERDVLLSLGAENGILEGSAFLISRKSRVLVDAESGETIIIKGKSARLKITELQARSSRAEIVEISPDFSVETGMSAVLDRSVMREVEASALESERGRLRLRSKRFNAIFPVARLHYVDHGIGEIKVRNTGDRALTNVRITFEIPGLMDMPVEVCSEERLREGAYLSGEVKPIFTDKLLEQTTMTAKQGVLKMSWEYEGRTREEQTYIPLKVMGRNALIWRPGDMMIGAFVNPQSVMPYRSAIMKLAPAGFRDIDPAFENAAVLFESLRDLTYVTDPLAPFRGSDTQLEHQDYIQFPTETLKEGTGDCDDLSVLFATLLQSVGINTRFLLPNGHIFLAFQTNVRNADWKKFGLPGEWLIAGEDGFIWIPVENTLNKHGFYEAIRKAAEEYRAPRNMEILVQDAWRQYEPVSIALEPKPPDVTKAWTGYRELFAQIKKGQDEVIEREYRSVLNANPADSIARKALAIYLWQTGRRDEAAAECGEIASIAPDDGEVHLILGALAFRKADYDGARGHFMTSGSLLPLDPRPSYNLTLVWLAQHQIESARRSFNATVKKDPQYARYEQELFGSASGARSDEGDLWRKIMLMPTEERAVP